MFYDNFAKLCTKIGTSPTAFTKNILGLSTSKVTAWKNGSIPKYEILQQIADVFNVSVGDLFDGGNEAADSGIQKGYKLMLDAAAESGYNQALLETKKAVPDSGDSTDKTSSIKLSESEWNDLLDGLSDESLVQLRDYTRYLVWKQDQELSD